MKSNILILSGFLGSGKTTLLVKLLDYLREKKGFDYKIAIIENEIGAVSVDSSVIEQAGYSVTDMLNGCVCCTLVGQLVPTVRQIQADLNPDLMILEATGVAEPQTMVDALQTWADCQVRVVTLVDVSRWQRIRVALRLLLERQIAPAHVLCLNKIDLVSDEEVDQVEHELREWNASAPAVRLSASVKLSAADGEAIMG